MKRSAIAFWSVVAAMWLSHAAIAWLAPLQGDDWLPMSWLARRSAGMDAWFGYAARHPVLGELILLLLAGARWAHVILTPTVVVAFFVGLVAVARGRVPRPSEPGAALLIAVASTFVWIGAPHAGLDFYYRPYLAQYLYGLTAVVWLVFVFVHHATLGGTRARAIGMFLLGLAAGSSNHHVVPIVLYIVWQQIRGARTRGPVRAWMWAGFAGLALGGLLLFTARPLPLRSIGRGGFEHHVYKLYVAMGECGELVSLVILVFFSLLLRARLAPRPQSAPDARTIGLAGRAYGAALISAVLAVFSPHWGEPSMLAQMLAPVAGLVVAALALLEAPLAARGLRRVMIAFAIVIHVLVLASSVPRYVDARAAAQDRLDTLAAVQARGIGRITPYRKTVQDSWFFGDDLLKATTRALVASMHGLRAIEYTETTGLLELSAGYTFDEVWSPGGERTRLLTDDLEIARSLFTQDARDRWRAGWSGTAVLELVGGLDWPDRRGRTLVGARFGDGDPILPSFDVKLSDKKQRFSMSVDPDTLEGAYPEIVVVQANREVPHESDDDDQWILPQRTDRYVLLACADHECWVVQSKWYQL